jgi:hypothetical protein
LFLALLTVRSVHLTSGKAERESIQRLSESLAQRKEVKVTITNVRKDGTPFHDLLALKPISDSNGSYAFVLGMQFDATNPELLPIHLNMLENIFRVLPNTIHPHCNVVFNKLPDSTP